MNSDSTCTTKERWYPAGPAIMAYMNEDQPHIPLRIDNHEIVLKQGPTWSGVPSSDHMRVTDLRKGNFIEVVVYMEDGVRRAASLETEFVSTAQSLHLQDRTE